MKSLAKSFMAVTLAMVLALGLVSCNGTPSSSNEPEQTTAAEKTTVRLGLLKGPIGMGGTVLMDRNEKGETANQYDVTVFSSPDQATAKIISGELDIAAVPTNLAAVLYQRTKDNEDGGIQLLNLTAKGMLYLLENGNTIQKVSDLKGKTIYATGKGSTPEYILNYILEKNGLDPEKDVNIEFKSEHAELATLMTEGTAKIGLLPEPNVSSVTMGNQDVRIALNMTEEWNAVDSSSELIMSCLVVQKKFAQENEAAVEAFLDEYKNSIETVISDYDAAAQLCEKFEIVPKAAVAKNALPNCSLYYSEGAEMKESIEGYYQVLFDADPESVGGSLPDDAFYYQR